MAGAMSDLWPPSQLHSAVTPWPVPNYTDC